MANKKDKRTKVCTNDSCEKKQGGVRFKATDCYCGACGHELSLACSECLGPIEDEGPQHRFCKRCEAEKEQKAAKRAEAAKKAAAAASSAAVAIAAVFRKVPKL